MLYKTAFTHSSDGFRRISITNMQRKRIRNLEINVNGNGKMIIILQMPKKVMKIQDMMKTIKT